MAKNPVRKPGHTLSNAIDMLQIHQIIIRRIVYELGLELAINCLA
jgi:hypothetical protein